MTGPATRHPEDLGTVRASYDAVADNYARMVIEDGIGDISRQPWLLAAIDIFADDVRDLGPVLAHCAAALRLDGQLIIGTHVGDEDVARTRAYGDVPVQWTTHRWRPEQLVELLRAAGLESTAELRLTPTDGAGPAVVLTAQRCA